MEQGILTTRPGTEGSVWRRIGAFFLIPRILYVIGLLLVLRPTEGAQVLVMLMGVSLLLDGALNLSVALCAVKVVRHQQPDVIETDDFEIE